MKKVGLFLILTFGTYLIGQIVWFISIYYGNHIFINEYYTTMLLIHIYNFTGIFGLISGIMMFNLKKYK